MTSTIGIPEYCMRPSGCMIDRHDCACDMPDGPYYPAGGTCVASITKQDQQAIYCSLTGEAAQMVARGGTIPPDTGLVCHECPSPAVYAVWAGPSLTLACSNAVHIAWASSVGGACPVSVIVPGDGSEDEYGAVRGYPVDPATVVPSPACGCDVYAETDGTFTIDHECATLRGTRTRKYLPAGT